MRYDERTLKPNRRRLTEADLDRHIEAKRAVSLPDLLLAKGSMTGPHRKARPWCSTRTRLRRAWHWLIDLIPTWA